MRKRIVLTLMSFFLLVVVFLGAAACAKSGIESNAEFKEYETIVTTVVEKSQVALNGQTSAKAGVLSLFSFAGAQKEDIFAYLNDIQDKTEADNLSFYDDVFEQSLYIPLMSGYAISKYHGAKTFYGSSIALPFYGQYVKTISEGTLKTTYCYTDSAGEDRSYMEFVVITIDYKSEDDFEFKALQFSADLSDTLFLYGNSDAEFMALSCSDASGEYLLYNERGGNGYSVEDAEALEYCSSLVRADFESVDQGAIRDVMESPQYTLAETEWADASEHYLNSGSSEPSVDPGKYEVIDGVFYGWTGDMTACPSEVTVPAEASSLYYSLHFPSHVTKLTIPATVKAVKISEAVLNESKDDTGRDVLVDCSANYLEIFLHDENNGFGILEEIELKGESSLFEIRNHCLYSKDGTLLYIPENKQISSLTLDGKKMSDWVDRELYYLYLPGLREADATIAMIDDGYEGYAYNPLEKLFSCADVAKAYALEKLVLRGLSGVAYATFEEGLSSVESMDLYGSACGRLDLCVGVPVQSILFGEGSGEQVWISLSGNGSIAELTLSAQVQSIELPSEQMKIRLPWSLLEFERQKKYELFRISDEQYDMLGWDYSQTEHKLDFWTLCFQPLGSDEIEDEQTLKNFPDVQYIRGDDGESYASIRGYYGSDSVVMVPATFYGYPVREFVMSSSASEYGSPTVDGVTELRLPAGLEFLSVSDEYSLKKIVYDGTMAQFRQIEGTYLQEEYGIMRVAEQIQCSDENFLRGGLYEWEKYDYSADNIRLLVWTDRGRNSVQVQLSADGEEYIGHSIERYSDNFEFAFEEIFYTNEWGDAITENKWRININRYYFERKDGSSFDWFSVSLFEYDNLELSEIVLKQLSVTESFEAIEHRYGEGPAFIYPSSCEESGYEEYRCEFCGEVYINKTDALGHDLGEAYFVEATCSEYAHMRRDCSRDGCTYCEKSDFDEAGGYAPHDFTSQTVVRIIPSTCVDPECYVMLCDACGQEVNDYRGEVTGEHKYDGQDGLCSVCYLHTEDFELRFGSEWTIVKYKRRNATTCTIPDQIAGRKVDYIAVDAFSECENSLRSLSLGSNLRDNGIATPLRKLTALKTISGQSSAFITYMNILYLRDPIRIGYVPPRLDGQIEFHPDLENISSFAFASDDFEILPEPICKEITKVTLHAGITSIESFAFSECVGLTQVVIEGSVAIDSYAFEGCTALRQVLGGCVSYVGDYAFQGCTALETFPFAEGLEEIGYWVFYDTKLDSVSLPASLTAIGYNAFNNLNLSSIEVAEGSQYFSSEQSVLFDADRTKIVLIAGGATHVLIPETVQHIWNELFGLQNVEYLRLPFFDVESNGGGTRYMNLNSLFSGGQENWAVPNSLKTVEILGGGVDSNAFSGCTGLESILLREGVTFIGYKAFSGCTGLTEMVLPKSVRSLKAGIFSGCTNLSSLTLSVLGKVGENTATFRDLFKEGSSYGTPNENLHVIFDGEVIGGNAFEFSSSVLLTLNEGLKEIDMQAFYYSEIEQIDFPSTLTSIGAHAFESAHLTSADIPGSVEVISASAFYACSGLSQVTLREGLKKIESYAFFLTPITQLVFPDSLTEIGENAFMRCNGLASVSFGENLISVGKEAFCETAIEELELPEKLQLIGADSFRYTKITEVIVPDSVQTIETGAFSNNDIKVISLGKGVQTIEYYSFWGNLEELIIPSSLQSFQGAFFGLSSVKSLVLPSLSEGKVLGILPYEECFSTDAWQSLEKITVCGGDIGTEFSSSTKLKEVVLENVSSVGDGAFSGKTELQRVWLDVESIGSEAFRGCTKLNFVDFGARIASVGRDAFADCAQTEGTPVYSELNIHDIAAWCAVDFANEYANPLAIPYIYFLIDGAETQEIVVPSGVSAVKPYAFYNLKHGFDICLSDGVTEIGTSAFESGFVLSIEVPASVTKIGNRAFCNASELTAFTGGSGVLYIGDDAFNGAAVKLGSIEIPQNLITVGARAFVGFNWTDVVLPDSVVSIGEQAFYRNTNLTSVHLGKGITSVPQEAFYGCDQLERLVIAGTVESVGDGAFTVPRLREFFYGGTATQWFDVEKGTGNDSLAQATIYYYIESEALVPGDGGRYWHYGNDGITPEIW